MLNIEDTILIVIDVQGKLAYAMHDKENLFRNLDRLIRAAQIMEVPILWTEQAPEKIGETIPEIKDLLGPNLKPIIKYTFGCCGEPSFLEALRKSGRSKLLICGIETHVCVYQTVRDLQIHGFEVHAAVDAISSRALDTKTIALERMRDEGVVLTCTEMAICELLKTAKHPKFRDVMAQIKR